jgi:DNA-directed RNA polymerase specialized sigma subunit
MLAEAQHAAQQVVDDPGPHRPTGGLFLPIERATDEFQQVFGRQPSIYEVAAGVASRPDLVDPVNRATLRWRRPSPPTVADSWFLPESVSALPRLRVEAAAVAGALLECLQDWEEQVMRSRLEAHMTQLEITHALAVSQLRACLALISGLDALAAQPMVGAETELPAAP